MEGWTKAVCALSLTDNWSNKIDSSVLLGLQITLGRVKRERESEKNTLCFVFNKSQREEA